MRNNKLVNREDVISILQDLKILVRDIDDFHQQKEIKRKIKKYESLLEKDLK